MANFRRHLKPLIWAELYSVRSVKPKSPRKLIKVKIDIGFDIGGFTIEKITEGK